MSLFKKKNDKPAIHILLDSSVERMREKGDKSFYYALFDNELATAQLWAKHHNIIIELDHITDGNKIYKFIFKP